MSESAPSESAPRHSAIKPIFATLEQALVIKSLGKLSQRDRQALKQMITRFSVDHVESAVGPFVTH